MLGHRPVFVEKAIERQLRQGFEIGPQTLLAGEVAEMICELTGNERATFCNTGSEAVTAAMRLARTVTGRSKIVFFSGDYHGMFDEVLVKGFKRDGKPQAVPVAPGIPREKAANVVVLEYGTPESQEWIRQNARDLAAVMVEPVQSRHPNLQPVEFLRAIRQITREADACLIFDEVVTGFRLAYGGAQEYYGVTPDICTLGKVIGGGFPLAAIAGRDDIMSHFDRAVVGDEGFLVQIGTLSGNPVASAAGLASMAILKRPGAYERIFATGRELMGTLSELLKRAGIPAVVTGEPPLFDVVFASGDMRNYRDVLRGDAEMMRQLNRLLFRKNFLKFLGHLSPFPFSPEIVQHQKTSAQQIFPERRGLLRAE